MPREVGSVKDGLWVSIGGRRFPIALRDFYTDYRDADANTFDTSREPTERSLGDRSVWKRSRHDFTHGQGQTIADDEDVSDPRRFSFQYNLDTWTARGVTLQRPTRYDTLNTNTASVTDVDDQQFFSVPWYSQTTFGQRSYYYLVAIGNHVESALAAGTGFGSQPQLTPKASDTIKSVAVVGSRWYVHWASAGTEVMTWLGETPVDTNATPYSGGVWGANGRLFGLSTSIQELDSGADPVNDPVGDNGTTGSRWLRAVTAPGGPLFVREESYTTLTAADTPPINVTLWQVRIDTTTGGLLEPVQVAALPVGEEILALDVSTESGLVVIGTNFGLRLAQFQTDGSLQYGSLLEVGRVESVQTFGRWLYFTIDDISSPDGTVRRQGCARADLSTFTDAGALVPAWSLWSTVAWNENRRVRGVIVGEDGSTTLFTSGIDEGSLAGSSTAVSALQMARSATTREPVGQMWSGSISFDTTETKRAVSLAGRWKALTDRSSESSSALAAEAVELAVRDLQNERTHGVVDVSIPSVTSGVAEVRDPSVSAETFEVITTLRSTEEDSGDSSVGRSSPTFERWTFQAIPTPFRPRVFEFPVDNRGAVEWRGKVVHQDTLENYEFLVGLADTRELVDIEFGSVKLRGYVDGVASQSTRGTGGLGWWDTRDPEGVFPAGRWYVQCVTVDAEADSDG